MKKFKLIKQYPGSPKVGDIVQGKGTEGWYTKGPGHATYDWTQVVHYPEYWEEIIEKDYEILSFSSNLVWNGNLAILTENGRYSPNPGVASWTLDEVLNKGISVKSGHIQIHSVKRLSDGEIFTIGDRAKTITSKGSHNIRQFRIRQKCIKGNGAGIYIHDGIDRIWIDWEDDCGGNWLESTEKIVEKDYEILISRVVPQEILSVKRLSDGEVFTVGDTIQNAVGRQQKIVEFYLNKDNEMCVYTDRTCRFTLGYLKAKPKSKPLFLTHDGKDIFEGDEVWYVNKENFYYDYILTLPQTKFCSDTRAYFLTRVEAEEYIIEKYIFLKQAVKQRLNLK